jgi:hypothetical protein
VGGLGARLFIMKQTFLLWSCLLCMNSLVSEEFLSPAALHRVARFWRRLIRVEIRASPILKDPRESNGCRSCRCVPLVCRAADDSDPVSEGICPPTPRIFQTTIVIERGVRLSISPI